MKREKTCFSNEQTHTTEQKMLRKLQFQNEERITQFQNE